MENLGDIRAMRRRGIKGAPPAPPPDSAEDAGQGKMLFLPEGCPVQPIGINGATYYYLDQLGQLRELLAKDHSRLNLQSLFGRQSELLEEFWPRRTQNRKTLEWETTGWKPEMCAQSFMAACADRGVWSAEEKVRGAGAWRGPEGELVLHVGDQLLRVAAAPPAAGVPWMVRAPGMVEKLVYPTSPPGLKPAAEAEAAGPDNAAAQLLRLFETWSFRRRDIDPHLMLGWVGAAMLGGALKWRAVGWITGGFNTGKSTLQDVLKWVLGDNGLLKTADGTPAAVRQILRFDSRPVAIDEAEAEEDGRKMNALVKLARDAATGSITLRGGQDHAAKAFTVRSCFMFGSILIPPLLPQDRSRICIFELDQLPRTGRANTLPMTERGVAPLGPRLLRRLVQGWWRFDATLEGYRGALAAAGHSARGQDLFGTLLACADLLLWDVTPDEATLAAWGAKLAAGQLAEVEGAVSDEAACLGYLLSSTVMDPVSRTQRTIGEWVKAAAADVSGAFVQEDTVLRRDQARKVLQDIGLRIELQDGRQFLAVANVHRGLDRVYDKTQWASRPGAQGVWVQALRRLPHIPSTKALWFGSAARATLIPLEVVLSTADSAPPPPAPPEPDEPEQWEIG